MPTPKTQVKVACLPCRSTKTRCDGQHPCATCLATGRECQYRPSRRGGARRGTRYEHARRQRDDAATRGHHKRQLSDASAGALVNETSLTGPSHRSQGTESLTGWRHSPVATPTADRAQRRTSSIPLVLRTYQNEGDLVNAYYIFIHPYLPLLPSSEVPRFADCPQMVTLTDLHPDRQNIPFWPTSPLGLALMAILVLIPLPEDPEPMREVVIVSRRSYARMFAEATLEAIGSFPGNHDGHEAQISYHPSLSTNLEPVIALLLMGVYEYCQMGNRKQMRLHIYQALIMAMDLSLHALVSTDSEPMAAQGRVWWMTMYLSYQSAIFNHSSPIVLADDTRITTPFPEIDGFYELVPALIGAQEALLEAGAINAVLIENKTGDTHRSISERIHELDSVILSLAAESDRFCSTNITGGADASAGKNLWLMARFIIHTARIKLHRFRAFGDYPVFLDKFCDLSSINSSYFSGSPLSLSLSRLVDIDLIFPFTEQESAGICLKSALVLSRILRILPWPRPLQTEPSQGPEGYAAKFNPSFSQPRYPRSLPYFACCGMQSCYVLMMLLRRLHALLSGGSLSTEYPLLANPGPGTEKQDIERLIEELQHGTKSVRDFMMSNAVFEGIADMASEVEIVYSAHFYD